MLIHYIPKHPKGDLEPFNQIDSYTGKYIASNLGQKIVVKDCLRKNKRSDNPITLACGSIINLKNISLIENTESGRVIIFDPEDSSKLDGFYKGLGNIERTRVCCVFKYQYQETVSYEGVSVFPFIYPPHDYKTMEYLRHKFSPIPFEERKPKIFFSGQPTSRIRRRLLHDPSLRNSPFNEKKNPHNIWNIFPKLLDKKDYFRELRKNRYLLSLPGWGNNCYREIESFGLGTVVIAPEFKNSYSNPLVPKEHYIPIAQDLELVDLKNACDIALKSISPSNYSYIQQNALNWYKNNIEIPQSIENIIKPEMLNHIRENI